MNFTLMFCVGAYGGFHITRQSSAINVCFGWMAFTIFLYDVQDAIAKNLTESHSKAMGVVNELVDDFETNYVLNGEIVDDPNELMISWYKNAKKL